MDRWLTKVAVVTGASLGIGAAISEELVKAGVLVVGLDVRYDQLEKLSLKLEGAKGKLYARKCDVRKENELLESFEWINDEFGGVDILVNNAGVGRYTKTIDDDIESMRCCLEVNVLAMAICTQQAIASMKSREVDGYVININSIFGHVVPNMHASLYTSSKHAVTALTETVRKELASEGNDKIKITSLSPGFVKTGALEAAGCPNSDEFFKLNSHLEPKDVAAAVLYLLATRDKVQVTELTIRGVGEIF